MAEAVMVALAPRIGRLEAHQLVERASRRAGETGRHLKAALAEEPAVTQHLSPADLDALLDPLNYLGQATAFVDRVLAAWRRKQEGTQMPFVPAIGARLFYRPDGEPEAPVLMLSNSLGTELAMWDSQVAELAKRFRVLRYDSRGHG